MSDNPGIINSTITARTYPNKYNSLMELIGKGFQAGSAGAEQGIKGQQALQQGQLEGQNKIAQEQEQGNQTRQTEKAQTDTSNDTFEKMYGTDNLADANKAATKAGQSLDVSKNGVKVGQNEWMKVQGMMGGQDMHAANSAYETYNHDLPELQKKADPLIQGVNTLYNENNTTTLGATKAALLRAYGLNRYNESEANALLPPSVQGIFSRLFTGTGNESDALTAPQRRDALDAFRTGLNTLANQHEQIKQAALAQYQGSSPTGSRAQTIASTLGNNGFSSSLNETLGRANSAYEAAAKASANPNAGGAVKHAGGWMSGLKNYLTGGSSPNPSSATVQTAPAAPKTSGLGSLFGGTPAANAAPAAPAAGGATSTGPHGDTIIQRGNTYRWNPQTKQYE